MESWRGISRLLIEWRGCFWATNLLEPHRLKGERGQGEWRALAFMAESYGQTRLLAHYQSGRKVGKQS